MIFIAVLLGIVEGLTEFLPVSSTGHLILAGHFLNYTGEAAATFEVFIQLGAILAIVFLYFPRFAGLIFPPKDLKGFSGLKGLSLLFLTTLPALILGALLHSYIKEHLFNPRTVAIGLVAGSFWIFAVEKFCRHEKPKEGLDTLTYRDALLIGLFQCLAMWPGVSRAGATILGAMMIGMNRRTATEYSFFAAAPVIAAASLLDLVKSLDVITMDQLPFFAVGFIVSGISALLIVKFFIQYVSRSTLNVFAWYRLALAALVLVFWRG
jgi:undecaprenyl-diphosphatase